MLISPQSKQQILSCIFGKQFEYWNVVAWIKADFPLLSMQLNDLVTDAYRGFACFPGPYRVSQEMLCFTCVPGKLQKKKTCSFYSSSDSDTSLSSERCSSAEREVSSTVFLYISLYSRGNRIKNLKKLPTTWEVLLPATTRQKLEVLQIQ